MICTANMMYSIFIKKLIVNVKFGLLWCLGRQSEGETPASRKKTASSLEFLVKSRKVSAIPITE